MRSGLNQIACDGCGAWVAVSDGPTHEYIGASPGCWSIYMDVLGREYGPYGFPECHRLTVDAYAVQHPGIPSRRSTQSVAAHLIALHLVLDRSVRPRAVTAHLRSIVHNAGRFVWLEPPSFTGTLSILDVAAANDLAAHERVVWRWAASVWAAWAPHHAAVREWAAGISES